jgi:cbb3-type cytochrome oxidase subunit 3
MGIMVTLALLIAAALVLVWMLRARRLGDGAHSAHADLDMDEEEVPEVVEIPIDGVLDLHLFKPKDLRTLVPDYLEECHRRDITAVRIIHGKGTGALRKSVHALLQRSPLVERFRLAGVEAGGWGATLVDLKAKRATPEED